MYPDLKKEYFLEGNDIACILIHGFTGTPAELRELGEKIHEKGFTVSGITLAGHGTKAEDMLNNVFMDWVNSALKEYNKLKKQYKEVYLIGHSMGSLISMYIAENYEVDKLILLSPPIVQKNKSTKYAGIIKHFVKYSKWPQRDIPSHQLEYLLGYDTFPINSVHELNKLTSVVKKSLSKITSPVLIVHSKNDAIVDDKSVEIIANQVSSKIVQPVFLETSGHLIMIEDEKETTFKAVIDFCHNKETNIA